MGWVPLRRLQRSLCFPGHAVSRTQFPGVVRLNVHFPAGCPLGAVLSNSRLLSASYTGATASQSQCQGFSSCHLPDLSRLGHSWEWFFTFKDRRD